MTFKTEIRLPYGKLQPVLDWCETNCLSVWDIGFEDKQLNNTEFYTFQFESETDYVNFLMWQK